MHFLIVGDSGTGKSAAIRQLLSQKWERGEAAIVYDPAMEYLPQFYNVARGDVILNPMDARCPFWSPADEVPSSGEFLIPERNKADLDVVFVQDFGRANSRSEEHRFLSKCETGDRRVDVIELLQLAEIYGKRHNIF